MTKATHLTAIASAIIGLAGCAGFQELSKGVDESVAQNTARTQAERARSALNTNAGKSPYIEHSTRPYLGSTSVPRPTDDELPSAIRDVTINFPGRFTIQEAAQLITDATGIPVTISPDVIQTNGQSAGVQTPLMMPTGMPGNASAAAETYQAIARAQMVNTFPITASFKKVGLKDALDSIAGVQGVNWKYKDGRITFFRYVSKTFVVALPTADVETNMTVGKTSSFQTGVTGSTTSSSTGTSQSAFSTTYKNTFKPWDDLKSGIQSFLSSAGKVVVVPSSGTIQVTDSRQNVDAAELFVEEQNRIFTRQVALRIEVVSLTVGESSEFGVDWSALLATVNADTGNSTSYSLTSPVGSSSTAAATAGVKLLRQVNGNADWSGSQALLKALNTLGKTSIVQTYESLVMNRRVNPVAAIKSTSYLAQTTPVASTTAGTTGGLPGLTPGQVSYGSVLNVTPTITSKNSLVLDFGMDMTELTGITTKSSGSGDYIQTIELPETAARQFLQSVSLNTGDTLIISGLEQTTDQSKKNAFGRDTSPGLGGLFQGARSRETLIILVTPVIAN